MRKHKLIVLSLFFLLLIPFSSALITLDLVKNDEVTYEYRSDRDFGQGPDETISIKIDGKVYAFAISSIASNSQVSFYLPYDRSFGSIQVGNSKRLDLNGDSINDVRLTSNSIYRDSAQGEWVAELTFKKLDRPVCGNDICEGNELTACPEDCWEKPTKTYTSIDLSDFPAPFVMDGIYADDTVWVVGARAKAADSIALSWITSTLQNEVNYEITPVVKLDNEIAGSEANYNLVIVGSPCVNDAVAAVPGFGLSKCEDWPLRVGEGIIKLAVNGDKVAMLVAGTTGDDTQRAAKVLENYKDYALSGTETLVSGTTINEATIDKYITEIEEAGKSIVEDIKEVSEASKDVTPEEPSKIKKEYKNYLIYGGISFVLFILSFLLFKYQPYKKFKLEKLFKRKPKGKKVKEEKVVEEKKEEVPSEIHDAVTVSGFTVKYRGKAILDNVSFKVKRGEFTCLIGESGAGKSTIIESLVGRKKPARGKIEVLGKVVGKDKEVKDYIGFVPQSPEIYLNRTVEKNLQSSAIRYGIKNAKAKIDEVLNKVRLSHRKGLVASKLSGGQKKLLSLAMELIRDPELLVLDEPTTGLDPTTRNDIITILCSIASHHSKTVLITTHFMDDAEEADDVVIVGDGRVLAQGSPEKLKKRTPGMGKMVSVVLEYVSDELLKKINKIKDIEKVIREGRTINLLTEHPHAMAIGQEITSLGGEVVETKITRTTMKEVFVYYTGQEPE